MSNNVTLILFMSVITGVQEYEYSTDRGFTVNGTLTNEAPLKYAVKRLASDGEKLKRIIALVTTKARNTALNKYKEIISDITPGTDFVEVDIPDEVTATELLRKTLDALLPVLPDDRIIIETTGGFRNAVNALTLLSRFLRYSGVQVIFSTYSDLNAKRVADTKEIDDLFDLLDAVTVFATTGNTRDIKTLFSRWKIDEQTAFFKAANNYYNSLLVCRTPRIEPDIRALQQSIEALYEAEFDAGDAKLLIFKELILTIVEQRMTFLRSFNPLVGFVQWCADNWYLQQAVTFLKESIVINNSGRILNNSDYKVLRHLRNSINHASGKATGLDGSPITGADAEKVNRLLDNPNEIKDFVDSLLIKIRGKTGEHA